MEPLTALNDNTVVYRGFLVPSRTASSDLQSELHRIRETVFHVVGHRLAGYIWQEEAFNLSVAAEKGLPHLEGTTFFGDNVDDEWFIVDLLFHLTEKISNLAFQVEDSDGDFLLIEGAEFLPSWLTPDTSTNRVFIFDGSLHLLPKAETPSQITNVPGLRAPTMDAALVALRDFSGVTTAPSGLRQRVDERRRRANALTLHHAHCRLPPNVAWLLRSDPRLIAPAVRAFHARDPLDLRALRAMKHFPPGEEGSMVSRRVAFTRCLYAQLTSQDYKPDRRSPWKTPSIDGGPAHVKSWNLGLKIVCGFEILASRRGAGSGRRQAAEPKTDFIPSNVAEHSSWSTFDDSLKRNGFYRGQVEGSRKWMELRKEAESFFKEIVVGDVEEETTVSGNVAKKISKILAEGVDEDVLRSESRSLEHEDSEEWLNINPEDLDAVMKEYLPPVKGGTIQETLADESANLESVTKTFRSFLKHVSDLDGAEFPTRVHGGRDGDELDSDDDDSADVKTSDAKPENAGDSSDEDSFDFDAVAFSRTLENMLVGDGRDAVGKRGEVKRPISGIVADGSSEGPEQSDEDDDDDDGLLDSDDDSDVGDVNPENARVKDFMRFMDEELASTTMGKSFEKRKDVMDKDDDVDDVDDEDEPFDLDLTMMKNFLESYRTQPGLAGPATNILQSMGVRLPDPQT